MPTLQIPISPVSIPAIERLKIAHIRGIRGAERVGVDGPFGGIFGVAVTVFLNETMEKLEQLARRAEVTERVFEGVVADAGVDQLAEAGRIAIRIRVERTARRRSLARSYNDGPVQRSGLIMFSLSGRARS